MARPAERRQRRLFAAAAVATVALAGAGQLLFAMPTRPRIQRPPVEPRGPEFVMGEAPQGPDPFDDETGPAKAPVVPKEAENFRTIEIPRRFGRYKRALPDWYAKHPCPTEEPDWPALTAIPGEVQRTTKREDALRQHLRDGTATPDMFRKTIQVFAQRSRQEIRFLPMQRREFLRRAKRWAAEMLLQERQIVAIALRKEGAEDHSGEGRKARRQALAALAKDAGRTIAEVNPRNRHKLDSTTVKLVLLGCASNGDSEGAIYWFKKYQKLTRLGKPGRLEYNAVITALGGDGFPHEAAKWIRKMEEAGFKPDARSYAGLIDGWEKIGNREAMLEAMMDYQKAEEQGELGKPSDSRDHALPYIALAKTYAKTGDSPRALSVLKTLQAKKVPMPREVHRVRLEAHLRTPAMRRNIPEIERALIDLIESRPESGPLFHSRVMEMCRKALGDIRYEEILKIAKTSDEELVPALPDQEATRNWRKAKIKVAFEKYTPGNGALKPKAPDRAFFNYRKKHIRRNRAGVKMGKVRGGFRVSADGKIPEWMSVGQMEKYG